MSVLKFLTIFLSLIMFSFGNNEAKANIFNKFKKGFYFEKYKTSEEATTELLKLHPIGSDVDTLIKTLEGAGVIISKRDMSNYKKFYPTEYEKWKKQGNVVDYSLKYDKASPFFVILNWIEWRGSVWIDINNKITFISLNKGRAY